MNLVIVSFCYYSISRLPGFACSMISAMISELCFSVSIRVPSQSQITQMGSSFVCWWKVGFIRRIDENGGYMKWREVIKVWMNEKGKTIKWSNQSVNWQKRKLHNIQQENHCVTPNNSLNSFTFHSGVYDLLFKILSTRFNENLYVSIRRINYWITTTN